MRTNVLISAFVTSIVVSAPVLAQEEGATTAPVAAPAPAVAAAPAPAAAAPVDTTTDHEKVVGKVGVGYLGQFDVPLGAAQPALPTQIVGVRYWLQNSLAITGGLGFFRSSSSITSVTGGTTTEVEGPAATAFSLKGGVALALATGKHYTFVVEPQLLFGYASRTDKNPAGGPDTEHSGLGFGLGANAGAEIQFGFMGIPELALVGSVGLGFVTQSGKTKIDTNENSRSATAFQTFTLANPWNIFAGNIAAIYYL